jgi:squalene-associated FAD-dependent desaturase
MKLAIVGAGWAGLACAIEATRSGHGVTLFEASRTLGGRARRVEDHDIALDNGQHILIGAYRDTLALLRGVGVDPEAALLRLPLTLRFADGRGLAVPALPPPFDLLAGIATARGWTWRDKLALVRVAQRWQRDKFACAPSLSVAALCEALTPRVMQELIEPLCVSALNTPAARASGQVFLRVLHDALFAERGGADLLLPRVDLGALFPDAATLWLAARGTAIHTGKRVLALVRGSACWWIDGESFDGVVLACAPWDAARLLRDSALADAAAWCDTTEVLTHEGIATVYATGAPSPLAAPILALRSSDTAPAQFVFDRGQLGGPPGLLAFVVSASHAPRDTLQAAVLQQAADQLGLGALTPLQTIVEKRATFSCTPGLQRPPMGIAAGLLACGDYVAGPYPSTLEGAVRSGLAAARAIA